MPTRQAWLLVAAAAATGLAGRVFGVYELFLLAAGCVGLVVVAVLRTASRRPRLEVTRLVHPPNPSVGEHARVELSLRAGSATPSLELWEPVGDLGGASLNVSALRSGERASAVYRLPTDRRGLVSLGPTSIELRDAFGLARLTRFVAPAGEVLVYPRWELVDLPVLGGGSGPLSRALRRRSLAHVDADEFHALRDYAVGDDLRRVHWRQSARRDDLVVRQTDPSAHLALTVVLDLHASKYTAGGFERAVSAVASLVASAAHGRRRLRLLTTDSDEHLIDDHHLGPVMEHLALVQVSSGRVPPRVRHDAEGLHVVIVACGVADPTRLSALSRAAGIPDAGVAVCCDVGGEIPQGWFRVDAVVADDFARSWAGLVGRRAGVPPATSTAVLATEVPGEVVV